MANKNKKINDLVDTDDDPTSELEALTAKQPLEFGGRIRDEEAESDAVTFDFSEIAGEAPDAASLDELRSDLRARSKTIEKLQFDIEQLHARWLGLETEIKAREALTEQLQAEIQSAEETIRAKDRKLTERDRSIRSLKAEIRDRNQSFRELEQDAEELRALTDDLNSRHDAEAAERALREKDGVIRGQQAETGELRAQLERTEGYADELRRRFSDLSAESEQALAERSGLHEALTTAESHVDELRAELDSMRTQLEEAGRQLDVQAEAHAEELRTVRFELDEAEETLAQNEEISEQLASDLADSRGFRTQLEHMLVEAEERSQKRIEALEKQVLELEKQAAEREEKLEAKSEAINCLLAELARKSTEIDSIDQMDNVIQDIGDRMSERIDERPAPDRDRITRLLIGRIDKQELRFPLFKDRLTIGRTAQNDIQLKAQYISRRHAVVVTEGDTTRVIDWGSKNGVYVNSKRITEHFLKRGDVVTIGTVEFRYEERPKRDI